MQKPRIDIVVCILLEHATFSGLHFTNKELTVRYRMCQFVCASRPLFSFSFGASHANIHKHKHTNSDIGTIVLNVQSNHNPTIWFCLMPRTKIYLGPFSIGTRFICFRKTTPNHFHW